jgi:hypothetical protein
MRFECLQVICVPLKEQFCKETELADGFNREFDDVKKTRQAKQDLCSLVGAVLTRSASARHTSNINSQAILMRHSDSEDAMFLAVQ